MKTSSVVVSSVASVALIAGSLSMASAAPVRHAGHADHRVGEDTTLQRETDARRALVRLRGKVNDDRDLTLSDTSLSRGRYRIVIRDSTRRHNWHIFGRGVDKETSVKGKGRWSWKVRLRSGTYTVVCDPHARTMRFTVSVR